MKREKSENVRKNRDIDDYSGKVNVYEIGNPKGQNEENGDRIVAPKDVCA